MDKQITVRFLQPVDKLSNELDTCFIDDFVGEIDLTKGVQVRYFAKDRIVVCVKFVYENLAEVTALLFVGFRFFDPQRFFQSLVIDNPFFQECVTDLISDVYIRHGIIFLPSKTIR